MIIWWLEWIQIHPLNVAPMGKLESNIETTSSLINNIFSDSILWHSKKTVPSTTSSAHSVKVMSNNEAIKFFWINNEDLSTSLFNQ